MKIGIASSNGKRFVAALAGEEVVDLSPYLESQDLVRVVEDWQELAPMLNYALSRAQRVSGNIVWHAPLTAPPKFLLLAGNFREHVVESGFEAAPDENLTPQFFMKPSTTIIGPTDDIALTSANHQLDYESELAVIIGQRTHSATLANAMDAVWGYTVVNDVSERKLNDGMEGRKLRSNDHFYDWLVGKWFDGSAPVGPYLVSKDEAPAEMTVSARLNGETVQEARTTLMIHSVAEAIVYISNVLTLEPGDLISMGTPAGVGKARGRLLRDGDVIECEVSGIGTLRNTVRQQ